MRRMKKYVVSLGAGHGGFDSGTIGAGGLAEKDVTLLIVKCISKRLAHTGAFDIIIVRADDNYIGTRQRARLIEESSSHCHIEIHVDLTQENAKSAAVWYSADIPADRDCAAKLSRRMARVLEIPDCGARVRFDYCMLFKKLEGFEDYYSLIEALGISRERHVFYCECGFDCCAAKSGAAGRLAAAMAEAISRTVCELFAVHVPIRLLPRSCPTVQIDSLRRPMFLKEGFFNVRSGPGNSYPTIRVIEGLIYTGFYEQRDGWLRLSAQSGEYISASAVDIFINPQPRALNYKRGDYEIETTGREGFYFVLADIQPSSEILGAVGMGTSFYTTYHKGFRKILYCDREGFIGPTAWSI